MTVSRIRLVGQYPLVEFQHTMNKLHAGFDKTTSGREILGKIGVELAFPENKAFLPAPAFRGGLGVFMTVTVPTEFEAEVRETLLSLGYHFED